MSRLLKSFTAALIFAASIGSIGTAHAALYGTLEQVSPIPTVYIPDTDFTAPFDNGFAVAGDVTGFLQAVDPFNPLGDGCAAGDFFAFTPGNIALVKRGTCLFSDKTNNAAAAGAIGILVFNSVPGIALTQMVAPTGIPFLFLSGTLGNALFAQLALGPVEVHMTVTPEPSALALLAIALLSMFGFGMMRRRADA